jgi:hypothetical protein
LCLRQTLFVPTATNSRHNWCVVPNLTRGLVLNGLDQLWTSSLILGRPPRQRRHEPDPQIAQKPRRRQRKTVAGWTMIRPRRQFAHQRDKNTQNNRSLGRKHGGRVPVRWRTAS